MYSKYPTDVIYTTESVKITCFVNLDILELKIKLISTVVFDKLSW